MDTVAQALQEDGETLQSHDTPSSTALSRDKLYELLANQRRRYVMHYLKYQDESVALGTLAEQVAAWEQEIEIPEITAAQRKSVYTALQQRHLPKMDEAGLISFNRRSGTVEPTELLSEIDVYAEIVRSRDFPWCYYYFGLSVVAAAALTAVWGQIPPFTFFTEIAWGIFCVISFAISAVMHILAAREMKLGNKPDPPTVNKRD